jgi:phosphoglycerate dehydrogenase-like enzyme
VSVKPKGLFVLGAEPFQLIYGQAERDEIAGLVDVTAPPQTAESVRQAPALLRDVEIVLSGWGAPCMDAAFLAAAPKLRAVFYSAGTVKAMVCEEFWQRGIVVCSAWAANAVPVAEFTLAQIVMALKNVWRDVLDGRERRAWPRHVPAAGVYGSTVGIVSLGMIGRRVCELLHCLEVQVLAYDPYVKPEVAAGLNVRLVGLEEVFRTCGVVSLHTPNLPETRGMITGSHFRMMRPGATFINTARGAVVRESEMIEALKERPDLWALLDVTDPEPPAEGSALYNLPNVILTPHSAGSLGPECRRMGRYMVDELGRYLAGEKLRWQVTRESIERMA